MQEDHGQETTHIKILVVDDRPTNILAIQAILEGSTVDVIEARSGEEALVTAAQHDLALILMDVHLPGIDGLETAERLRRTSATEGVPIIFLTAYDSVKEQIDKAYTLGAVDFLTKPLVPKMLLAKMSVFIDLYRKTQAIKHQEKMLREAQDREHERQLREERATWKAEQLKREVDLQSKIAEERGRYEVILRCIKDAVVAIDANRHVALLNHAAEDLFGITDQQSRGKTVDEVVRLIDPGTRLPVRPEEVSGDVVLAAKEGEDRLLADSIAPIIDVEGVHQGAVLVYREVTTQRRMERDIHNQQRIESLGHLAGGIAHDFNNMLGMILASTSLLRAAEHDDAKSVELLHGIEVTCERATGLTRQLLTFARGGAPVKKLCDPARLIRESAEFSLKGGGTICDFRIDASLWRAELDAGQITQMISNLVLNAREAMADQGSIAIEAKNVEVGPTDGLPISPGPYIEIHVQDRGPGIPQDEENLVFDPYFTTKSDHNGLGLASAYSVVKRHGGLLRLESVQGMGAAFAIFLPAVPGATIEEVEPASEESSSDGRVLVMDDEEMLRSLMSDCLSSLRYRVETAACGEEAIEAYRLALKEGDPFDIVILDLTIRGGMGGAATLEQLKSISPDVVAIACSGYANDPIMCDHEGHGFAGAIEKPFRFAVLARAVRGLIARKRSESQWPERSVAN